MESEYNKDKLWDIKQDCACWCMCAQHAAVAFRNQCCKSFLSVTNDNLLQQKTQVKAKVNMFTLSDLQHTFFSLLCFWVNNKHIPRARLPLDRATFLHELFLFPTLEVKDY